MSVFLFGCEPGPVPIAGVEALVVVVVGVLEQALSEVDASAMTTVMLNERRLKTCFIEDGCEGES